MEQELETIAAIYSEEYERITKNEIIITIQLSIGPVSIHFIIPDSYPKTKPFYSIHTCWPVKSAGPGTFKTLQQVDLNYINENFEGLFVENEVVLFEWIEWLRNYLQQNFAEEVENVEEEEEVDNSATNFEELKESNNHVKENGCLKNVIKVFTSLHPIHDKKSEFVGHFAFVNSVQEVQQVRSQLLADKKIAKASHPVISAYRIFPNKSEVLLQDCDDDGETQA
ncbi:hypothetical protein HK099_003675, partial [Clydaea vesicula]